MKEDRRRAELSRLENTFEKILWYSRLVVLVPVIASIVLGFAAVYLATVEVIWVLAHLDEVLVASVNTASGADAINSLLATIIKATDIYLLAAILLIFGIGLYELFIDRIDPLERRTFTPQLLFIRDLEDLKERLAKVVLLVLIIEFLQYALRVSFQSPLDLLELAIGILLVGGAIYLTTRRDAGPEPPTPRPP